MKSHNFRNQLLRIKLVIGLYKSNADAIKTCQDAKIIWEWIQTGADPIVEKVN